MEEEKKNTLQNIFEVIMTRFSRDSKERVEHINCS